MIITLVASAYALDCTGLNANSCNATNQVASQVNLAAGSTVITESSPEVRLRESSIYDAFETLRLTGEGSACDVSGLVGTGTVGGSYRVNGAWSGTWAEVGGPSGDASGWSKTSPRRFWGTLTGNGTVGNFHSSYTPEGRILGNVDDGFAAGEWIRTAGRRGVFFVLYGDCPTDEQVVFASWLDGTPPTNVAPVLTSVVVTPTDPTEDSTLTCSAAATDANGDTVSFAYAWSVGGSTVPVTSNTLSGTFFDRDDSVTCTVTPNDGTVDGASGSDSVTIANTAPSISSVSVSPGSPLDTDTLTCSYSGYSDADGDADASTYSWTIGGTEVGTSSTLAPSAFTDGDVVTCTVTPDDGTDSGTPFSDSVSIGLSNQPPVLTSVVVTPTDPTEGSTLTCSAAATDANGDTVSFAYAWSVGGSTVPVTSNTLSGTFFDRDDSVTCTVTPNDGTVDGASGSDSVTILNSAPSISSVSVSPSGPSTSDTLTCSYSGFSDADGDSDASTYSWTIGGTVVGTASTLSSSLTSKGDTAICTVTPFDGTDSGTPLSGARTVVNSAPTISSVSISPSIPTDSDTLTCSYSGYSDADGDADASTYSWTIGGTVVGTSSTLSSSATTSGDTVLCTVTPFDGTDAGTPMSGSVSVGASNTAPTITSILIQPSGATVVDDLTCQVGTFDAEGDTVTLSYAWTVNGSSAGTDSDTLTSGFAKGDSVGCTATPNDGTVDGASDSDTTVIQNEPPVVSGVTINPSSPVLASTLTASFSSSDADGDSVTVNYAWFVNGSPVSLQSFLPVSGNAVKGDTIHVEITPEDGEDFGGTATSGTVTVGNTAPTAPVVDATDDPAVGVDDIVCALVTPSTDVDTPDTISYSVAWTADGAVYPDDFGAATGPDTTTYTDDTVPAGDTSLASDWTCTMTATDGTASAQDSDTTTVVAASSSLLTDRSSVTYAGSGSYTTNAADFAVAQQVTFPSSVTITGMGVNWAFGYCTTCSLAIYANGAAPGALLGEGHSTDCGTTSSGNNETSFASSFTVPAGTYWMSGDFGSCNYGATYYIADEGGATSATHYQSWPAGTAHPDPWGATTNVPVRKMAYYPIGY